MKSSLRQAGIDTPEAALAVLRQAWRRGVMVVLVAGLGFMLVAALFPRFTPLVLGLGLFLLVWVVTSGVNGRRYIRRYIDEELGGDREP